MFFSFVFITEEQHTITEITIKSRLVFIEDKRKIYVLYHVIVFFEYLFTVLRKYNINLIIFSYYIS